MSYNKSDGSRNYNKSERGGWYCTNPKRHEEEHAHHAPDEPHQHQAERNDAAPNRNDQEPERSPQAHQKRTPSGHAPFSTGNIHDARPRTNANPSGKGADTGQHASGSEAGRTTVAPAAQKNTKGCINCMIFMVVSFFAFIMLGMCVAIMTEGDNDEQDSENGYYDEQADSYYEDLLDGNEDGVAALSEEDIISIFDDAQPADSADDTIPEADAAADSLGQQ